MRQGLHELNCHVRTHTQDCTDKGKNEHVGQDPAKERGGVVFPKRGPDFQGKDLPENTVENQQGETGKCKGSLDVLKNIGRLGEVERHLALPDHGSRTSGNEPATR